MKHFEALAEFAGEGFHRGSRNFTQGSAEKLLFDGGQSPGERGDLFFWKMGDRRWKMGSSRNFGLGLAVPFYGGGFGDGQAAADGGEAEALDAEAEEFVTGGGGVHGTGAMD